METDRLTIKMGSEPNLSVKRSFSIDTMVNFDGDGNRHGDGDGNRHRDGDGNRHGDGDGTCKQALNIRWLYKGSSLVN